MMDLSNVRLQLATISSPRKEPKVSTFCRGGGKRRLDVVEVAEDGVGVERGGRETAVGGGGGGCWEDTWDEGGTPPTPWGEAVEARCRGDDSPPATTKNTRDRVNTSSHTLSKCDKSVLRQNGLANTGTSYETSYPNSVVFNSDISDRGRSFLFLFFSFSFYRVVCRDNLVAQNSLIR